MSEIIMPPSENNSDQTGRPAGSFGVDSPPPPPPPAYWQPQPRRRKPLWKRLLIGCAVLLLILLVIGGISAVVSLKLGRLTGGTMEAEVLQAGRKDQVVALYEVVGVIDNKQADSLDAFCRQVSGDPNVKAVVLRIDSPGGGVSSCDRMHKMLMDLKSGGKKLVVSMGSLAASGGYYISAPAETIYAEPTTVTGSIGVLGSWIVIKGTLEKYGARAMVIRSTKTRAWKAAPNLFEDPADYQIESLRKLLDVMQARFEKVVLQGRGDRLTTKTAEKTYTGADGKEFTVMETVPFNGNIFTADEALGMGLIDKVGYLDEAIESASRLAGLSEPKTVKYSRRKGFFEQLGEAKAGPMIDLDVLDEIQTPKLMMIWKVEQ